MINSDFDVCKCVNLLTLVDALFEFIVLSFIFFSIYRTFRLCNPLVFFAFIPISLSPDECSRAPLADDAIVRPVVGANLNDQLKYVFSTFALLKSVRAIIL